MNDDSVYNKVEIIRLVADALRPRIGKEIDRVSFNVSTDGKKSDEVDDLYIVIGNKKWRIKIDEGENDAISI